MIPFMFWIALIELSVLATVCSEANIVPELTQKRNPTDVEPKFKKMCQIYRVQRPTQYAVLWIGDGDYSGKANKNSLFANRIDTGDYFVASHYEKDNPAATAAGSAATPSGQGKGTSDGDPPNKKKKPTGGAVPIEKKKHDEDVIFDNVLPVIQRYTNANPGQKPDLFMYSYNSPCCGPQPTSKKLAHEDCPNGCSGLIRKWLTDNKDKIKTLTIAWDKNYRTLGGQNDPHFLFGMYSILRAPGNVKILWNDDGYCRTDKRGWFQKEMFDCMNMKDRTSICTAKNDFKPHLATLINHVTWKCGTRTKKEAGRAYKKAARESACWEKEVSTVVTKTDDKANTFKKTIKDCAEKLESINVGPALHYSGGKLEYSNSALDIKAGITSLCFIK